MIDPGYAADSLAPGEIGSRTTNVVQEVKKRKVIEKLLTTAIEENDQLKTTLTQATEVLTWLMNLAHNVGKAGGEPDLGEWDAAWGAAKELLESLKGKGNGEKQRR